MKTPTSPRSSFPALAVVLGTVSLLPTCGLAQGNLNPPGAPGPTMKTLEQVEPRTPIASLPYVISKPGSYYVTTNLTGIKGSNGITIDSDDVTLDLNGFTLLGVTGSLDGIYVGPNYHYNITVQNGTIDRWDGNGVEAYSNAENTVFTHLTLAGEQGSGDGLRAYGSRISNCVLDYCGGSGLVASLSEIRHCVVNNCYGDGIDASDSKVLDCVCEYDAVGIYVQNSSVSGCHTEVNYYSGIYVDPGYASGSRIADNTSLSDNTSAQPGDAGISVNDSNTRVENNHVTDAGFAGIQVSNATTNSIIIKNTISGNGNNNIVASGSQVVGPLITNTGTITQANPWANFSF